jgi:hypothetical protein
VPAARYCLRQAQIHMTSKSSRDAGRRRKKKRLVRSMRNREARAVPIPLIHIRGGGDHPLPGRSALLPVPRHESDCRPELSFGSGRR